MQSLLHRYTYLTAAAIVALVLTQTGCTTTQQTVRAPVAAPKPVPLNQASSPLQKQLVAHYQEWAGTPYRAGGLSQRGVDCSGFVYLTFRDQLGRDLPRTTQEQLRQGKRVARTELDTGDLVFFRTGFKTRHVGIYLGDNQFLHASSSRGVMISSLSNNYWDRAFLQGRRVN